MEKVLLKQRILRDIQTFIIFPEHLKNQLNSHRANIEISLEIKMTKNNFFINHNNKVILLI